MVRLTREVRFGINLAGEGMEEGENGFAGRPALTGLGSFLVLRVTVQGEPDLASGYLLNIKDIDRAVRERVVPEVREVLLRAPGLPVTSLVLHCADLLRQAWAPRELSRLELRLSPFLSYAWNVLEPTMIQLSQKFEFSAAHRLHSEQLSAEANLATFGKCNNPHGHGHNYELEVTVAGEPDAVTGVLIGVEELERIVDREVIEAFDHKHLNLEVSEFSTLNPSVENIARVIYDRLALVMKQTPCTLAKVTVWETPKTWAEYGGSSGAGRAARAPADDR